MIDEDRLVDAEQKVEAAREQLIDSVQALARALEPKRLIGELWEDAKVKGADLAEDAVDAVKARPIAATGIVAAIAMFLAREPLIDAAGRVTSAIGERRRTKKTKKAAPKGRSRTKISTTET